MSIIGLPALWAEDDPQSLYRIRPAQKFRNFFKTYSKFIIKADLCSIIESSSSVVYIPKPAFVDDINGNKLEVSQAIRS